MQKFQDLLKKEADILAQELNKRLKRPTVQQYDIVIGWWIDYIIGYSYSELTYFQYRIKSIFNEKSSSSGT